MHVQQAVLAIGARPLRSGMSRAADALACVGGRPFLDHVLAHLSRFGIEDVLLLMLSPELARLDSYRNRTMFGMQTRVIAAAEPTGIGRALRLAGAELQPIFLLG